MNKVRIGFVGMGHRGVYLSKLYHERIKDCKVVALCRLFWRVSPQSRMGSVLKYQIFVRGKRRRLDANLPDDFRECLKDPHIKHRETPKRPDFGFFSV